MADRTTEHAKPRVFSGIQPTGRKTLGNYSGGFRQYVQTQAADDAFFCIVDLHSITVEYDPDELRDSTLDLAAMLFATGLDAGALDGLLPEPRDRARRGGLAAVGCRRATASCGRMTQFKEKSERHEFVSAGLFTYPVLMAGDILLYQTDLVPIGDDQRQHLELARDVAERFNHRYGETFRVPRRAVPRGRRADHGSAGADEQDVDDARAPSRAPSTWSTRRTRSGRSSRRR